jgi:hypothetical protein
MLLDLRQDMFFHIHQHEITEADNKRYKEIVLFSLIKLESLSSMKIDMKSLVENIERDFKILKDEMGVMIKHNKRTLLRRKRQKIE